MCCISTDSTTSEQRLSSAGKHGGIQSTVVIVPPRHTTLSPSPVASTPNPSVAPGSKHERSSTVARLANDLVLIATHYPELSENLHSVSVKISTIEKHTERLTMRLAPT
eukprot:GHVQ01009600.1.p1 GENE.GHVQ01009600.1~~GHVQ01009600.1.p1  ORF type:complete len:109 (-),score=14.08 GHVQ01009600.1:31-357(-)